MKKIYCMLFVATLAANAMAEKGAIILKAPDTDTYTQVTAMSANGEWVCGMADQQYPDAFVWNTVTGEMKYLSQSGESQVYGISNDGVAVGLSPDNAAAYWKDGEWHRLDGNGIAYGISPNGQYIAGQTYSGGAAPCVWGPDGSMTKMSMPALKSGSQVGAAWDVTNDGRYVSGTCYNPYTTTANYTTVIWKDGEPNFVQPKLYNYNCVAKKFSENGIYYVTQNGAWGRTDTDEIVQMPYNGWNMELFQVANDGTAVGYVQDEMMGACRAIIYPQGGTKMRYLSDYLTLQGADVSDITLYSCIGISADGKRFACNAYTTVNIDGTDYGRIYPIVILLDEELDNRWPAKVEAEQLDGIGAVEVKWTAPFYGAENVKSYKVFRNEEIVGEVDVNSELRFVDKGVANGNYTYAVTACYESTESEKTTTEVTVADKQLGTPRDLVVLSRGLDDIRLLWEAPSSTLPTLNYYNDDDVIEEFLNGSQTTFEPATRYRADVLAAYGDNAKIEKVSFYPQASMKALTVNIYDADNNEVLYSQEVDVNTLKALRENEIMLNEPFAIPAEKDIIVGLSITTGSDALSPMGAVMAKAVIGYSDLVRTSSNAAFESLYNMSMTSVNGSYEYRLSWAMGICISTGNDVATVTGYDIKVNNAALTTTSSLSYVHENLTLGQYVYEVAAKYSNGYVSEYISVNIDFAPNTAMLKITPSVSTNDMTMTATWSEPIDDDATNITYGRGTARDGATDAEDSNYAAAVKFKSSMFTNYDGYVVKGLSFYPLVNCDFLLLLYQDGELIAELEPDETEYTVGQWSTVLLDEPIALNTGSSYQMVIDCWAVPVGEAPLAMDNHAASGYYSDLYSTGGYEDSFIPLSESYDNVGNWMMGMVVATPESQPLGLTGYKVLIDGVSTDDIITDTQVTKTFEDYGQHRIRVDAVYGEPLNQEVRGDVKWFTLTSGIEDIIDSQVSVYPNPASEYVAYEGDAKSMTAYSLSGSVAAYAEGNTLDVSTLAEGLYIIKVETEGKALMTKVIVKK